MYFVIKNVNVIEGAKGESRGQGREDTSLQDIDIFADISVVTRTYKRVNTYPKTWVGQDHASRVHNQD